MSWTASTTGGSGLAGYKVFRGGAQIATTTSPNYSNTGLTASTAYSYAVAAYDNAGNTSAQSAPPASATTPACTAAGAHVLSKNIGGPAAGDVAKVTGSAVDSSGNVAITGTFVGTIDLGGGPLRSTDDVDIFVGKYSSSGALLWAKRFGMSTTDFFSNELNGVAIDGSGNVYVTGTFYGTIDFGGGPMTASSGNDTFIVKFAPDGTHLWSKSFSSFDGDTGKAIAVDPSGNVLVTGILSGWVDFGGGVLRSAGSADIYVVKLSPTGTHLWSKIFGDLNPQFPKSIASDTQGNVLLAGYYKGTVDFGGGPFTSGINPVSGLSNDGFLAKFSPIGAHLWSKSFGELEGLEQQGHSVAADRNNNVLVTGYVVGTVDFGGGSQLRVGMQDIFLAKYSATGALQWAKRFGATGDVNYIEFGTGVAADSGGNVVLTGYVRGPMDFGGGVLPTADLAYISDTFIAKFGSDGSHVWSKRYGDTSNQNGRAVVTDSANNVLAVGDFIGAVNFGGGALTTPNTVNPHVYLVKLTP